MKLDIVRLGVLIWIVLPVPIYLIIRQRRARLIKRMPAITSARIVQASYTWSSAGDADVTWTNAGYKFSVAGTDYSGQGSLAGVHKPGDEVVVRFNPARPEESVIEDYPTILGWAVIGLFILAVDLGVAVFAAFIGLLCLFAAVRGLIRRPPQWPASQWRAILLALVVTVIGLAFAGIGIVGLIADGFWEQNFLWVLWNHK